MINGSSKSAGRLEVFINIVVITDGVLESSIYRFMSALYLLLAVLLGPGPFFFSRPVCI